MNKMDEQILVVDRNYLFEQETLTFQGVTQYYPKVKDIMNKLEAYFVARRGDAETNKAWKQPISYVVVKRSEEVFLYKRLKAGGEKRLHEQLSIGVGGHVNLITSDWRHNLKINMFKELAEELTINFNFNLGSSIEPEIYGLINDDSNDVGSVHIGILAVLDLPEDAEVTVKETDKLEGSWVRIQDLKKTPLFESLETWSQFAVEVL